MNKKQVEARTIFLTLTGSHAYGLNTPESDEDYRGVCIPTPDFLYGLHNFEQYLDPDRDLTIYSLKKSLKLIAEANPNMIEMLWIDDKYVKINTKYWKQVQDHRDYFLSSKVRHTYSGYAMSQLRRIERHRRWFLDPPEKPSRAEYGLPDTYSLIPADQLSGVLKLSSMFIKPEWREIAKKEKAYHTAKREWDGYRTWKKNRNPKRAQMEEEFGLDCYSDDTEFLTRDGFKKFDDVKSDDKLATVFMSPTEKDLTRRKHFGLEYQNYTHKFDNIYNGPMFNLVGFHTDTLVTANHRMLYRNVGKNTRQKGKWKLEEVTKLPNNYEILRTINPKIRPWPNCSIVENLPVSVKSLMLIMGWYLSDGTIPIRKNKNSITMRNISISQKKNGRLYNSMRIYHRNHKYNLPTRLYEYHRRLNGYRKSDIIETRLVISNKTLVNFIGTHCGRLKEKRIPRWVLDLSRSAKEVLIHAICAGDGTIRPNSKSWIYYTSLPKLADDIQILALSCGWETSLYGPYKDAEGNVMHQVHLNKNTSQFRELDRKSIRTQEVKNKRTVCFSVPNGTLITRRNGHIGIHGNCKHASHLVRLYRQGIEILKDGEIHVDRTGIDAGELRTIKNGGYSYDEILALCEGAEAELDSLYQSTNLPKTPNHKKINELCIEITEEFLRDTH